MAKASDETHGEGYDLSEDNSKKSFSFSKRHPSNNYTIDKSRIAAHKLIELTNTLPFNRIHN